MSYRRSSVKRRRRWARFVWLAELHPSVALALGVLDARDRALEILGLTSEFWGWR